MATDSRGHAPGDELQTDIPSRRLIIAGDDDPLEDRGAPEISVDRGFKSLRPHFLAGAQLSSAGYTVVGRRDLKQGASTASDRGSESLRPHFCCREQRSRAAATCKAEDLNPATPTSFGSASEKK